MRTCASALAAILCLALLSPPARAQEGQGAQDPAPDLVAPDPATPDLSPSAQTAPPPLLTLDQERLFRDSAWGQAAFGKAEADGKLLATENRRIEEALETEERDLTERRATMSAADFAALASAFDVKVEDIRAAQDGKTRSIQRQLEDDRKRFFDAIPPILGDLLAESGATAILADSAIVMSLSSIDITATAIARIDARLPAPVQDPAPQPAP